MNKYFEKCLEFLSPEQQNFLNSKLTDSKDQNILISIINTFETNMLKSLFENKSAFLINANSAISEKREMATNLIDHFYNENVVLIRGYFDITEKHDFNQEFLDLLDLNLDYDELIKFLTLKYGVIQSNYFSNRSGKSTNDKIRRGNEGLFIHHVDEWTQDNLNAQNNFSNELDWQMQMPSRLVYCNFLEHTLLHQRIYESANKAVLYYEFMADNARTIIFDTPTVDNFTNILKSQMVNSKETIKKLYSNVNKDKLLEKNDSYVSISDKLKEITDLDKTKKKEELDKLLKKLESTERRGYVNEIRKQIEHKNLLLYLNSDEKDNVNKRINSVTTRLDNELKTTDPKAYYQKQLRKSWTASPLNKIELNLKIHHKTFGIGKIDKILDNDSFRVIFNSGKIVKMKNNSMISLNIPDDLD